MASLLLGELRDLELLDLGCGLGEESIYSRQARRARHRHRHLRGRRGKPRAARRLPSPRRHGAAHARRPDRAARRSVRSRPRPWDPASRRGRAAGYARYIVCSAPAASRCSSSRSAIDPADRGRQGLAHELRAFPGPLRRGHRARAQPDLARDRARGAALRQRAALPVSLALSAQAVLPASGACIACAGSITGCSRCSRRSSATPAAS